jgi:hypothetical protein
MLLRLLRSPRMGVSPWAVIGATGALALGLTQLPLLYDLTVGSVERKASSFSYLARGAANERSWQIFLETAGLGVGLGSHRPSSLFFLVLSCLGLVGTVLLAVLIAVALRRAARTEPAAGWALLGVVVSGVIAVPDLSMPVIWVGVAVCVGSGFDTPLRGYSSTRAARYSERRSTGDGAGTELLQGAAAQVPALQRTETAK